MSLELTIGANVQPAITAINDMKKNLQSLKDQISKTTDPTEINKLTGAIINQKNQIQQSLAATNGFATGVGGVSRAARLANTNVDQLARSIESFSSGGQGAIGAVNGLLFTFERLKGTTGSTKAAIGALAEEILSPAGLILAVGTALPLIIEFGKKLLDMAFDADKAKADVDALSQSLKTQKELIENFGKKIDFQTQINKLRLDLKIGPGTDRTVAELNEDLEGINDKARNIQKSITDNTLKIVDLQQQSANLKTIITGIPQIDIISQGKTETAKQSIKQQIDLLKNANKDLRKEAKELSEQRQIIPLKIQVAESDQARADAKKIVKNTKDDIQSELKLVDFVIPIRPEIKPLIKGQNTFQDFVKDLNKGVQLPKIDVPIAPDIQKRIDQIVEAKQEALKLAQTVQGALTPAFESVFQAIESHQNVFKAFFKSLEQAVVQMVSKFLAAAAAAEIVSLILTGGSSGFTGLFSKLIGGGLPKFAEGGIVNRPTLGVFGEAGPEVIMPLDKLKGMLGGLALNNQAQSGEFRLSGNDLVLAINRTQRTQGRGG